MGNDTPTDPVYRTSLSEFWQIIVYWLVFFVWVIGYCSPYGFPDPNQPIETVLGMPAWVFWGIFLPWIVSAAFTTWFALARIADHPLDESAGSELGND